MGLFTLNEYVHGSVLRQKPQRRTLAASGAGSKVHRVPHSLESLIQIAVRVLKPFLLLFLQPLPVKNHQNVLINSIFKVHCVSTTKC